MLKKIFMGICCFFIAFTSSGCEKTVLTPTYEQTTGDYVLNISVSETSFKKGEDIEVTMVFENNSGKVQNVSNGIPAIRTYIVGHSEYDIIYNDVAEIGQLAEGNIISTITTGSQLPRGTYELIAIAEYDLRTEEGLPTDKQIIVYSNAIFITVTNFLGL